MIPAAIDARVGCGSIAIDARVGCGSIGGRDLANELIVPEPGLFGRYNQLP
jgi:hypothetical protein